MATDDAIDEALAAAEAERRRRTGAFLDEFEKARRHLAREKAHEARIETLKRRAQNNIDRAHNRALDAVVQTISLTPDDANAVRLLKRKVRHADEFGAT